METQIKKDGPTKEEDKKYDLKGEGTNDAPLKRKLEAEDEAGGGSSSKKAKTEEQVDKKFEENTATGAEEKEVDQDPAVKDAPDQPLPCGKGADKEDHREESVVKSVCEEDMVVEKDEQNKSEEPKQTLKKQTEKKVDLKEEKNESSETVAEDFKVVVKVEKEEQPDSPPCRYPTRNRSGGEGSAEDEAKDDSEELDVKVAVKEESANSDSNDGEKAASVRSESGSDKENLSASTPADLSNAGTPDIITLSDEEESDKKGPFDKSAKLRRRVRRLQAELRNEEAKLVLLKKLRQSQQAPPQPEVPVPNNTNNVQPVKPNVPRQSGAPPALVRGPAQPGRPPHLQQHNRSITQGTTARNMQGPPPLVGTPRGANTNGSNGLASQSIRNLNQPSSNQRNVQQQQQLQQQQQQQTVPKAATPPQPPVDTQTPAQRQAAAKLALRKQLEKTLLQIPPPKPPAPEMNFIPSLACPDFVLLLGLEEVVNHIIDVQLIARGQKSPDEKFICNPFTCVQCGTDYTPVWKREKPGSKNVICEHCVTWNQKRALKQEHTNRLKSAFVKALQQEQEIERMQAPTSSASSSPAPSATSPAPTTAPPQALAAAAAVNSVAAAMSLNSASYRASAEQLRQQQNFLQQAHQAQLRASQPLAGLQAGFGARGSFPYTLPFVKQADLQRHQQYLLDMIPRANMPWKH